MFVSKDFRDRLEKVPFTPFEINTSAREKLIVTHPELILVGKRDLAIGIAGPDDPIHYDRLLRGSILHITAVEDLPIGTNPPVSNGQA
jgi:hypothetical protein